MLILAEGLSFPEGYDNPSANLENGISMGIYHARYDILMFVLCCERWFSCFLLPVEQFNR